MAKIRPVFKKGHELEVWNYRSISLLLIFSKCIKKVVGEQLAAFLEGYNLHCRRQNSFQNSKSTKLALIDFLNECIEAVDAGDSVISCFADLSLFKTVLMQKSDKLANLGVKDLAFHWFKSYKGVELNWQNFFFNKKQNYNLKIKPEGNYKVCASRINPIATPFSGFNNDIKKLQTYNTGKI